MAAVTAGSQVTVKLNGQEQSLTIVEPDQTDPTNGFISFNSPIAQALLGVQEGDLSNVQLPNGNEISLEVVSVG